MTFAEPRWLVLLSLVPALAVLVAVAGVSARRALARALSAEMLERVVPARVRSRRAARDVLAIGALGLAVVALAEPRFDKQVQTVRTTGTDIVVALDLSRSMDATDVDPSRLVRARRELADLGQLLDGDRVALVFFAGGAFQRLPLTGDFPMVQHVVDESATDIFETQGSDLGAAIRASLELLSRSDDPAGQAILVLSDGETHEPDQALEAAASAATAGVPIFAMGVGVEPSPVPLPGGRVLEWQGQPAVTSPDFEILQQAAKRTGGAFVTSNAGSKDMASLYEELRRTVRSAERGSRQRETWRSAFQWPLGLSALLLLLSGWLGDGRRAFGAAAALLLVVAITVPRSASAADRLAEADALYRAGKYPQAVEELTELSLERPDDPVILERLGAARYRAGDFEGAARAFDAAAEDGAGPDARFDSGNAHYQSGKLEDALQRYEAVLAEDPAHVGAAANRDLVQKEIEVRRAQRPPPPPPPPKPGQDEPPPQPGGEGEEPQPEPEPGSEPQDPAPGSEEAEPGESPDGEPEDGGVGGEDAEGAGKPSEAGSEDGADGVDPAALDAGEPEEGAPEDGEAQAGGEPGGDEGPITAGQAERLLESVGEGTPRMVVGGRSEGKPW
jgi:Ca-activated chloride channel homolog